MQKGVEPALDFLDQVLQSKTLHLVWLDTTIFQDAVKTLKENRDRRWSFTDCTSFAIMHQLNIKESFAFDKNFQEAGFTKLP